MAGYDAVAQAEGGLMSITGDPDGAPYRLGLPITDLVSGLFAAQGILLALLARTTTGCGRHVDVSMLDSVAALLTYQAAGYLATGANPPRMGNAHATSSPRHVRGARRPVDAVGNDDQWRRFCDVAGLPALASDERFSTNPQRVAHRHVLLPMVARCCASRPPTGSRLREAGVRAAPCAPSASAGGSAAPGTGRNRRATPCRRRSASGRQAPSSCQAVQRAPTGRR
jgi:crotonobetainyl-CoA:carnitine CoA-transferase CaiB-like acyl-CoA transferase